jgi:peptidoglycan/LPS O-acetylase OafA/YrhL
MTSRLNTLTSLRFFFALSLVAVHLLPLWASENYSHWPATLHDLLNAAYVGLPFFYALSGFVLFYTYGKEANRPKNFLFYFWAKRFARIAPVFYLSLALGISVLFAERGNGTITMPQATKFLAINLAFLSAWIPSSLAINFPTWSISVEMFCYFLFPFLLPLVEKLPRRGAWIGVGLCMGAGALIQVSAALLYPALWQWPWNVSGVSSEMTNFLELHPLVHFPEFLFGIFVARARAFTKPGSCSRDDLLLALGFGIILLLVISGLPWPFLMLSSFLFLPCIGLILWGGAGARGRFTQWLELPALLLLGEVSYAVYVFHMPLSYWFSRIFSTSGTPYLLFSLFTILLTAMAIVAHKIYDLPLRAIILRKFAGKRW